MEQQEFNDLNKDRILSLWARVTRPGVEELVSWLSQSDFFSAPCSKKHHLACVGGLAEHSLNVYDLLREKVERYKLEIPFEAVIICGLGHDLCKVNYYEIDEGPASPKQLEYLRSLAGYAKFLEYQDQGVSKAWACALIEWYKTPTDKRTSTEPPGKSTSWVIKDQFPMGHGEKSVSILQDFIRLTEEEKLAIRWHMAAFDPATHFNYPSGDAFNAAVKKYPLVALLFAADYEATQIIERET